MKIFLAALLAFGFALLGLGVGRLFGRPGPRGCHGCGGCSLEDKHEKHPARP